MADYSDRYDQTYLDLARKYFDKHWVKCSAQEQKVLIDLGNAQARLVRVDKYLHQINMELG